jgi:hypothetical protein
MPDTALAPELQGFENVEALQRAMAQDPALYDKVLKDLEAAEATKGGAPAAPAEPPAPGQPPAPPAPAEEFLTIKLPKSALETLGTYGKNRTPEEGVLEALKGNRKKDEFIDTLRRGQTDREGKLAQVQTELEAAVAERERLAEQLKKAAEAPAAPVPPAAPGAPAAFQPGQLPPLPKEPEMPSGDAFLDQEIRDKYFADRKIFDAAVAVRSKAVEGMSSQFAAATAQIQNLSKEIESLRSGVTKVSNEFQTTQAQTRKVEATHGEFDEIESFRARNKNLFASDREIFNIESDYIAFLGTVASVIGQDGVYVKGTNTIRKEVLEAVGEYQRGTSDNGRRLQQELQARGVGIPEDIEDLTRVYKIREFRSKYAERSPDGKLFPISYDQATRFAVEADPELFKIAPAAPAGPGQPPARPDPREAVIERQDAIDNIRKQNDGRAFEPDPAQHPGNLDVANFSTATYYEIISKPKDQRTEADKAVLRQVEAFYNMKPGELENIG